jgi:pseudouridine-5'-phosphate glycosidase
MTASRRSAGPRAATSDFRAPLRVDTVEVLAGMMRAKWDLGIRGGISIANPVPTSEEMPRDVIDGVIARALHECDERGIAGKDITPFLLGRIVELTDGASLRTNIALVRNNARLGAALAVAYHS